MALKLRLARGGRKGRPFHKIVVADSRMPRDGRFIEKIGTYNPLLANDNPNRVSVKEDRAKYWLTQGAQPSERVAKLLSALGLVAAPVVRETPKKSAPKEKARMRAEEKVEKLKAKEEEEKLKAEEAAAAAAEPTADEGVASEETTGEDTKTAAATDTAPAAKTEEAHENEASSVSEEEKS